MFNRVKYYVKLIRGGAKAPQNSYKRCVNKYYAKQKRCNCFIETGTYLGDMVESMKTYFQWIGSAEIQPALYERAKERFVNDKGVHLYLGDSSIKLNDMIQDAQLKINDAKFLFWLDAHYSGVDTGKGELDTPIMQELNIINHLLPDHVVILIDDARCFTHEGEFIDYPTVEVLKEHIIALWFNAKVSIRNDIIRVIIP